MAGNKKLIIGIGAVILLAIFLFLSNLQASCKRFLEFYPKEQWFYADRPVVQQQSLPADPRYEQNPSDDPRDKQSLPDDHPSLVFLRKFGKVDNLPDEEEIKSMSDKAVHYTYQSFLDNIVIRCHRKLHLGKVSNGGYPVCDDYLYRPIKPCLVYSFGIMNDFSFDDAVAKFYGCDVHCFDPSMKAATHRRSEHVWFYKLGLAGNAGKSSGLKLLVSADQSKWGVKTLGQIKTMLKHVNKTLDLLKIDIEFSEWQGLENMIAEGELSRVRQLLIEFHTDYDRTSNVRWALSILSKMEALGFRQYFTNMIGYHFQKIRNDNIFPVERRCCHEMGFVNTRMARN